MTTSPVEGTRSLLRETLARADPAERDALTALDELFDEPARIAIAGMVKAGKSTLLNALVGERVAPTDAGECTRIPTWYRRGRHYEVRAVDRVGSPGSPLSFARGEELVVDLASRDPASVDHLLVACPTNRLSNQTLIDLPGHASLSPDVARRAQDFLMDDEGSPVDGVVYLLRHRHPADLEFLEAFHSRVAGRGAVGALGVLSRADEVFGGDLSAMDDARRVSGVLRGDRRIRGLCQDVVPVAGLVAESAATLRNDEVEALRAIAGADPGLVAFGVSSVDRFRDLDHAETTPETRMRLLERFGLFGVRAAIDVLGRDPTRTGDALSSDLLAVSGIGELRAALDRIVLQRVHELRARVVLRRLASSPSLLGDRAAAGELERIQANAHGLRELEVAELLRRGSVPGIGPDDNAELQRLVGVYGVAVRDRLAAPPGAGRDELRSLAGAQHGRWQRVAESPLAAPVTVQVASTAVRTCEAMLMSDLAPA